ncbi:hypothetical protein [Vreelandella indica]|uniref:hypothetical protein n=1 Tax=Vreelandella indica TaxID=3126500 RepID=UPI00300E1EB7
MRFSLLDVGGYSLERGHNENMGKNIDIGVLSESFGTEFEYREFASDTAHSNEQQRWKLLDGIAKYAPGVVRKSVERSKQVPLPPVQIQKHINTQVRRAARTHQETISQSNHAVAAGRQPHPTPTQRYSFGHLFDVYSDNEPEKQLGKKEETSLKELLRLINS